MERGHRRRGGDALAPVDGQPRALAEELEPLLAIIEDVVGELAATGRWRVQAVGALDMLPDHTAKALVAAQDATAGIVGLHVNVAVGYGGRREIADAVRAFLREHAEAGSSLDELAEDFDMEHIADRLYTKGQPDPELVIRTSGEQRLGGFLLWQSAHSEFCFCEAYWPDFRRVDFLRRCAPTPRGSAGCGVGLSGERPR